MSDLAARILAASASQQPEGDALSARVLDAALEQFEQFGIAKTTLEDIANRAGIARVTIYRRFGGKDALIDAVLMREFRRHHAGLLAAVELDAPPIEQISAGFRYTLRAVQSHRLLQRLLATEPETLLPHLTIHGEAVVSYGSAFLVATMANVLDDGRDEQQRRIAADVVTRLLISYVITPGAPIDFEDDEAARSFAETFLAPILAPGSQPS